MTPMFLSFVTTDSNKFVSKKGAILSPKVNVTSR